MVAYSFQRQFIEPIQAGTKAQTIRAPRKRHARPGEQIQLYTAMRSKYCRPIGIAVCLGVTSINLDFEANCVWYEDLKSLTILRPINLDTFAQLDGFPDWKSMREFWFPATTFAGLLIRWTDFAAPKTVDPRTKAINIGAGPG